MGLGPVGEYRKHPFPLSWFSRAGHSKSYSDTVGLGGAYDSAFLIEFQVVPCCWSMDKTLRRNRAGLSCSLTSKTEDGDGNTAMATNSLLLNKNDS